MAANRTESRIGIVLDCVEDVYAIEDGMLTNSSALLTWFTEEYYNYNLDDRGSLKQTIYRINSKL